MKEEQEGLKKGYKKGTVLTGNNVLEEAKNRIKYAINDFDKLYVSFSGGKDSLVVLKLYEMVLDELGRTDEKVHVVFRDEEVIPDNVIDFLLKEEKNPRYEFKWFVTQMDNHKFILGERIPYIQWDKNRKHLRQPPDFAIKVDGTFDQYTMDGLQCEGDKGRIGFLTGIRADESLVRLNSVLVKKDLPFIVQSGVPQAKLVKPVYDWKEVDIFKFFYDFNIEYCHIYDLQFWNKEELRVATPLDSVAAKKFHKIKTRDPIYYQQLIDLFPEMKAQDKYWGELDRFSIINNYEPSVEGILSFIKNELNDDNALAMKRIRSCIIARNNKLNEGQFHNLGGYPYYYLFKTLINGSFKQGIQAEIKISPKDIEFEKELYYKLNPGK